MSDLVQMPDCWFSHAKAHIKVRYKGVCITRTCYPDEKKSHIMINMTSITVHLIYNSDLQAQRGSIHEKFCLKMKIWSQMRHLGDVCGYFLYVMIKYNPYLRPDFCTGNSYVCKLVFEQNFFLNCQPIFSFGTNY